MMNQNVGTVHGHTLEELSILLRDSTNIFDSEITLDSLLLGGWSNLNLRGRSAGIEFVLKLPWSVEHLEINPYEQLFALAQYLSRSDIAAHPLDVGRLPTAVETPFYIVEYIEGTTYSSFSDVTTDDLVSLNISHKILREERPPGLPRYDSPNKYLNAIRSLVLNHEWLPKASEETRELLSHYESQLQGVISVNESIGSWSGDTMHGDLWIPNVVFRSGQKPVFLDLEACTTGDSRYDLAYLLEAHENGSFSNIASLLETADVDLVHSLRPLVLACVIDWSIARLLSMESGIVEPNLNSKRIRTAILRYVHDKIGRLKSLLT